MQDAISGKSDSKVKQMETYSSTLYTVAPPKTIIYFIFKNCFSILILKTEGKAVPYVVDFPSVEADFSDNRRAFLCP